MKKLSVLLAILLIIPICTSCTADTETDSSSEDSVSVFSDDSDSSSYDKARYIDLGIPLEQRYTASQMAIYPWDMIVFDDYLYVGSGDWQTNKGPIDMWRYDIKNKEWEKSGSVPDETVNRFLIIDGKLTAPGIDPRAGWEFGNYYVLNNDKWETIRTIPNGIHVFDLAELDGKIFAALGMENHYPVAVSSDGGKSFSEVPFYRDGVPLIKEMKNVFLYDIFVLNDKLYAIFQDKIYVYDGSSFNYSCSWNGKLATTNMMMRSIAGKVNFKNKLYFTTGYLFACDDVNDLKYIKAPQNETVYDIYTDNDSLYILCGKRTEDKDYLITVYKSDSGEENDFEKVMDFRYDIPAISFAFSDNSVYFGMTLFNSANENNGKILEMEITK